MQYIIYTLKALRDVYILTTEDWDDFASIKLNRMSADLEMRYAVMF